MLSAKLMKFTSADEVYHLIEILQMNWIMFAFRWINTARNLQRRNSLPPQQHTSTGCRPVADARFCWPRPSHAGWGGGVGPPLVYICGRWGDPGPSKWWTHQDLLSRLGLVFGFPSVTRHIRAWTPQKVGLPVALWLRGGHVKLVCPISWPE